MSARFKFFAIAAGLVVVFFIAHSQRSHPPGQVEQPQATATPLPVEAPTVSAPETKTHSKSSKPTKRHESKHAEDNDDGESNIKPDMKHKLVRVVRLYASWPGPTPKQSLINDLRREEPFITESAVKKIEEEWSKTPNTFKIVPKQVVNISDLLANPKEPDKATATVFLTLSKLFKPAKGKPYSQSAVQSYTVKLQIIGRKWSVVSIAPQSGSSAASSSS
jgi:hypothetical protein